LRMIASLFCCLAGRSCACKPQPSRDGDAFQHFEFLGIENTEPPTSPVIARGQDVAPKAWIIFVRLSATLRAQVSTSTTGNPNDAKTRSMRSSCTGFPRDFNHQHQWISPSWNLPRCSYAGDTERTACSNASLTTALVVQFRLPGLQK
jgi:hypothetical protein